ncbi:MAG: hypothetical protein ACLR55_02585 [Roseburia sp.]
MEFRLATGNAGTGMYQRGTFEHGREFVPVARRKYNYAEIPCASCRRYAASGLDGPCSYSVKATGKTVYQHEKHAF